MAKITSISGQPALENIVRIVSDRTQDEEEQLERTDIGFAFEQLGLDPTQGPVEPRVLPNEEVPFFENYRNLEPNILFVADYVVEGEFVGVLLVWEKYFDSTHYEVFRRNSLGNLDKEFSRILFLDEKSLQEETVNYQDYIEDVLGFRMRRGTYFAVLDTVLKQDRLYEYKIKAARVPTKPEEISYADALRSNFNFGVVEISPTNENNIFDAASVFLGGSAYAWILAVLNGIPLFSSAVVEESLYTLARNQGLIDENDRVTILNANRNDVMDIFKDSVNLFGMEPALRGLLRALKVSDTDIEIVLSALDSSRDVFSYDKLLQNITSSATNEVVSILRSGNTEAIKKLNDLGIFISKLGGSENIFTLENLSNVLVVSREFIVANSIAFSNLEEIRNIIEEFNISVNESEEVVVSETVEVQLGKESESQTTQVSSDAGTNRDLGSLGTGVTRNVKEF